MLAKQLGIIIAETTAQRDAALAERDARINRLEAQVETLTAIIGGDKVKGAKICPDDSVIDVPNWRKHHG